MRMFFLNGTAYRVDNVLGIYCKQQGRYTHVNISYKNPAFTEGSSALLTAVIDDDNDIEALEDVLEALCMFFEDNTQKQPYRYNITEYVLDVLECKKSLIYDVVTAQGFDKKDPASIVLLLHPKGKEYDD